MGLDKNILNRVVRELASVAGTRVRALDVFFYYQETGEDDEGQAISHSIGEAAYVDQGGYLDRFIAQYGTLARTDRPRRLHGPIKSKGTAPTKNPRLVTNLNKFKWNEEEFKIATVAQLTSFLAQQNFGKYYFLTTVHHCVQQLDVHLSTFIVFAEPVKPEKLADVWNALLWLLLTTVGNPVTEELSTGRAYYRREWRLLTLRNQRVRHIIQNVPVKLTLGLLRDAIAERDWEEAKTLFKALEIQDLIRDYASDILYQPEVKRENLLLMTSCITTYAAILKLLAASCENPKQLIIEGLESLWACSANAISLEDLVPALLLVTNIWQNAWTAHKKAKRGGKMEIFCRRSGQSIELRISNDGTMPSQFVDALNTSTLEAQGDGRGISDILSAASELKGAKISAIVARGRTSIQVTVKSENEKLDSAHRRR